MCLSQMKQISETIGIESAFFVIHTEKMVVTQLQIRDPIESCLFAVTSSAVYLRIESSRSTNGGSKDTIG